jgi:hypothetical protein
VDNFADQIDAAFRAGEGYSSMASSFHPELREQMAALLHRPRGFPPVELLADQLPSGLSSLHDRLLDEQAMQAATESPGIYVVWDRYPDINWPVPVGLTPPKISGWMISRYGERRGGCGRCSTGDATDGLLASAGCAIALLSFCKACRYQLIEDFDGTNDLFWL